MSRQARKNLKTPFMHMMVQGINKEYIFHKQEYIEEYLDLIKKNQESCQFTILAYCMMSNHAHFLVYAENIKEFSDFMHKINTKFAQKYNKEEKRCGVVFRNRYLTEPIYDRKYLINCIKYIHNNPVKAKIVEKCEDYQYSSYNDYINNTGIVKSNIMLELFGEDCDYSMLFKNAYEKRYIDISEDDFEQTEMYILEGIREFLEMKNIKVVEILLDRVVLKDAIYHLKKNCGMKYSEIREFFEMSRGAMDVLKN